MLKKVLSKLSNKYASKWLILCFDLWVVMCTFFFAYLIRFNFRLSFDFETFVKQIPIVIMAAGISFILVGSHRGVIRFTGFRDVVNVVIGANILATILISVTYVSRKFYNDSFLNIPGSIVYIHLLLNFLFLIGIRFFVKSLYRKSLMSKAPKSNIMIYGAGNSGMITFEAITGDANSNLEVVGFIDDNPGKTGKKINQANVYRLKEINADFIKKQNVSEVVISIQNIDAARLLEITGVLFALNLKVKIVPPVQQWIDGDLSLGQIKEVKIEDLLGRDPIEIKNPILEDEYENQVILVTGAAGSIGSEIIRKLLQYNYKQLILVDIAESYLYDIQQELKQKNITNCMAIVADVRDKIRMNLIFETYKPKIVFHAAAYKHVPLMENNPYEAVSVNIVGTKNIVDLSIRHLIKKFVLISTDKAVNPTNVMGATKRIAELYITCQKGKGQTKFITTRFGNVLGSNGSVIPLFKRQIEAGGPLTVTHPDITRFFMTIPEACQLVLEASAMGNGGEIFVFDMGKSIKIYDLAMNMIILSGLKYPEDIDIKITGLRPGEKIYEELLADGENTRPTYHEKIMIAKTKALNTESIESKIIDLASLSASTQNLKIVSLMKDIVPEYRSNNSKFEVLDN
jgi:FlaA1/EpsC-like NDP-sugar epimerase